MKSLPMRKPRNLAANADHRAQASTTGSQDRIGRLKSERKSWGDSSHPDRRRDFWRLMTRSTRSSAHAAAVSAPHRTAAPDPMPSAFGTATHSS